MLRLLHDPPQQRNESHPDVSEPSIICSDLERSILFPDFLRREELAKELGCSARTIDRWQALREGPPRVRIGRTILYNVESVRNWLRSREQDSTYPKGTSVRSKAAYKHPSTLRSYT
jgi:predicted DNA-binding transcriptional regulator AlpA